MQGFSPSFKLFVLLAQKLNEDIWVESKNMAAPSLNRQVIYVHSLFADFLQHKGIQIASMGSSLVQFRQSLNKSSEQVLLWPEFILAVLASF